MCDIQIILSEWNEFLIVLINGVEYDISHRVPESVWCIGGKENFPKSPKDDWEIRKKLSPIIKDFISEIV